MVDVEAAFLNVNLKELLYVEWVEGMVELGYITLEQSLNWCAQCIKSMYGSVEAPRAWIFTFISTLSLFEYKQSKADPCGFLDAPNQENLSWF